MAEGVGEAKVFFPGVFVVADQVFGKTLFLPAVNVGHLAHGR